METVLDVSLKQAKVNLALGAAIFVGAALFAHAVGARAQTDRDAVYPQLEVWASIARQGNDAVREIRREAGDGVKLAQPAPLAELATVTTEVAAK